MPLDGDALKIEKEDLHHFKDCMQYVKRLMGGNELLNNEERYVLWLVGVKMDDIKQYKVITDRIEECRKRRFAMSDKATQKLADKPMTFRDTANPERYIALPMVSSENREYIPMVYLDKDVIPTNQIQTIPSATLYHFSILTSSVHMAWTRAVCGRLEMRYRYSKDIVYNNFPWPYWDGKHPCLPQDDGPTMATTDRALRAGAKLRAGAESRPYSGDTKTHTEDMSNGGSVCRGGALPPPATGTVDCASLEASAQHILDVRAKYPDKSLAELYNKEKMPEDLREAHRMNDDLVMQAYGFDLDMSESEVVARLMEMYESLRCKR